MGGILKRLKPVIDWGGTVWTVLGWLGLGGLATSLGVSIGAGAWAVLIGIPVPLVIMAAFCTLVGGLYLMLLPMAYRVLAQNVRPAPQRDKTAPNYTIWKRVQKLTITQAAYLWSGCDPHAPVSGSVVPEIKGWVTLLKDAIRREDLNFELSDDADNDDYVYVKDDPSDELPISRSELQHFAEKNNFSAEFLKD